MTRCPDCEREVNADDLTCSDCDALIHGEALRRLYGESREAQAREEWGAAMGSLVRCLDLLPPESQQYSQIRGEIQRLGHLQHHGEPCLEGFGLVDPPSQNPEATPGDGEDTAPDLGRSTLRVAKSVLGSLPVAFAGLTHPKTLFSMVVWVGTISFVVGWTTGFAIALMIYVHEIGHIVAMRHYGYRYSWPVFVPFLGAFVLQGKRAGDPAEGAVIALAGPLAGVFAGLVVSSLVPPEGGSTFDRILRANLLINLLNLLPMWILDGARFSGRLSRRQLFVTTGVLLASTAILRSSLTALFSLCYLLRSLLPQTGQRRPRAPRASSAALSWAMVAVNVILITVVSFALGDRWAPPSGS